MIYAEERNCCSGCDSLLAVAGIWLFKAGPLAQTGAITAEVSADSYLKWQVELELTEILGKFSGPVLYVTHDRDEVHRNCQKVCVLDQGKSQPLQTVRRLFEEPETLSVCLLSGCKIFLGPERWEVTVWRRWTGGSELTCALPENLTYVGVRAHYLRFTSCPGSNRIQCRVERVVDELFSTIIMPETPGGGGIPTCG